MLYTIILMLIYINCYRQIICLQASRAKDGSERGQGNGKTWSFIYNLRPNTFPFGNMYWKQICVFVSAKIVMFLLFCQMLGVKVVKALHLSPHNHLLGLLCLTLWCHFGLFPLPWLAQQIIGLLLLLYPCMVKLLQHRHQLLRQIHAILFSVIQLYRSVTMEDLVLFVFVLFLYLPRTFLT